MDHVRDYERFKNLVRRICTTLDKYTGADDFDPLMESWWKALRHVDYSVVEHKVERFLANAGEKTPFPRPSFMRPKDLSVPDPNAPAGNHIRDYWRSVIVADMCWWLGMNDQQFEPILIAAKDTLGGPLRALLDECEQQDRRDGRTVGQHRYSQRITGDLARQFQHLRTDRAPSLPAAQQVQFEDAFV
jgi:hypothetical protein